MTYTQKQLIARIERQIDINATIIERLGDDSAAASELSVETATMDIKILEIALSALESRADAEPVAYMIGGHYLMHAKDPKVDNYTSAVPLYTRPQPAPVVVPDERSAFEAFMAKRFGDIVDQRRVKNGDQEYMAWDMAVAWVVWSGRAAMLQGKAEPVSQPYTLPSDYLQGYKDGCEWSALMAEANQPQTGDWLYDDPLELAKAIRKGPDMLPTASDFREIPNSSTNNCRENADSSTNGWIPCSERLPAKGQEVLCTDQFENYETALYDTGYIPGPPFFATTAGEFHPTHWMPLPAAPQQETNNG